MRLLFVCPYAPSPIRTRPHHLLRHLAQRGHDITLATVWESAEERRALADLERSGIQPLAVPLSRGRIAANLLSAALGGDPLQARYSWQPELARRIRQRLQHRPVDLVHIEHLRGAIYGRLLRRAPGQTGDEVPVLWDSVDCITSLFEQAAASSASHFGRWVTRLELVRTRRYETRALTCFDRILVTSRTDQRALQELHASNGLARDGNPIQVLTNGVDLEYFRPDDEPRSADTLVFTGKMSYHANITAAIRLVREIMPKVWERRPQVKVWLVGKNPARQVRRLQSPDGLVQVFGSVPDLRPYLRGATLAVAPIAYGAGIQNKVIEAMACATPVVATPQAAAGLEHLRADAVCIADGNRFAGVVLELLSHPERRTQMGQKGRQYVEEHHDWTDVAARLEEVYLEVIGAGP